MPPRSFPLHLPPPQPPPHTFPSSPVIPRHPSTSSPYSSSPRGDGVSRPLVGGGGAGRQGASVADSRQVRFFVDTAEQEGHMRTCTQTHQGVWVREREEEREHIFKYIWAVYKEAFAFRRWLIWKLQVQLEVWEKYKYQLGRRLILMHIIISV